MKIILYLLLTLFSCSNHAIDLINNNAVINKDITIYRTLSCYTLLNLNNIYAGICDNEKAYSNIISPEKYINKVDNNHDKHSNIKIQFTEGKHFYVKPYINQKTYGIQLSVPLKSLSY